MPGDWENVFITLKAKLHMSWSSQSARVNPRFCSMKHPPPPPPQGDRMIVHHRVTSNVMLLLSICTPGWREMVKQNFLTIQMILHLISFQNKFIASPHISLYLFCLLQWHFVPVQVIPEVVHSGFQSKWNSRSGVELFSGNMKAENNFTPNWKMQITCSLEQVAHVYLIWHKNCLCKREHLRLNQWFYHVNAVWTSF